MKKLSSACVKKILCDPPVVAMAQECQELAKAGQFEDWQLEALAALDQEWMEKTLAIATADLKELPHLGIDPPQELL